MQKNLKERFKIYCKINNEIDFVSNSLTINQKIKESQEVIENLEKHIIPVKYPNYMLKSFEMRDMIIQLQGFAIITDNFIKELSYWIGNRKVLEVMSGCGSLTYNLIQKGINIIATDDFTWEKDWNENKNYWTYIRNMDAIEAVKKYGKYTDIIIMSWPYMDDTAYRVLVEMRNQNPNCQMIYIGENEGGCTANDDFFETIKIINDITFDKIESSFQRFWGLNDHLYLVK